MQLSRNILFGMLFFMIGNGTFCFAQYFGQEQNGLQLVLRALQSDEHVLKPQKVNAEKLTRLGVHPVRVSVHNKSGGPAIISPSSFKGVPIITDPKQVNHFPTRKGVIATGIGMFSLVALAKSIVNYYRNTANAGGYHVSSLKWPAVFGLVTGACWYYVSRYGVREDYLREFKRVMLTDDVTVQPGKDIQKLIFVDNKGYNTPKFDVCLYDADNKSKETTFHVNWH